VNAINSNIFNCTRVYGGEGDELKESLDIPISLMNDQEKVTKVYLRWGRGGDTHEENRRRSQTRSNPSCPHPMQSRPLN
jgi:hypothetical protein